MFSDTQMQNMIHDHFQMIGEFDEISKESIIADVIVGIPKPPALNNFFTELYEWAIYGAVKRGVDKYLTRAKKQTTKFHKQLSLEGFEHIQMNYSIERDGLIVVVPLDEMTDAEIIHKIQEHETQAQGHVLHADELRRYLHGRNPKVVSI